MPRFVSIIPCKISQVIPLKKLVMEDLIQNAPILFDEHPLQSSPNPPPHMAETMSTLSNSSLLSSEFSLPTEAQAVGPTAGHRRSLVSNIPASTQSSFPISHPDSPVEGRLIPALVPLLSPLLGLSPSQTFRERTETTTEEQDIPEARGSQGVGTLPNSLLQEVVSGASTSDAGWWLPHPGLRQHSEEPTIPQSPPESVRSSSTDFSFSSASLVSSPTNSPPSPTASLQSAFGDFCPAFNESSQRF